ncbi:piwi-like protein Siwi isoform X2 [Belonocnema kinseyi]|uniref:piwi-like protein Siwi isoform X2 n=1 Tax=Belonocnema kinseyi TaxID=2817044 RepID=UPI00143D4677|nr:piwi-like protein Siwi isoform X2 [Belonocnema kinseyi]
MADQVGAGRAMGRARGRARLQIELEREAEEAGWARRPGAVAPVAAPGGTPGGAPRPAIARTERAHRAGPGHDVLQRLERSVREERISPQGSAEGAAPVGRGGMRGRRRVNESESLLTRPTGCASKQGSYGQKINLQANYFKLETESVTDFSLYQYRVDFSPDEERTVVRKGLLRFHHPSIGPYIFDGTVMYSNSLLAPNLEFFSTRLSDNQQIRITIRMVGELRKGDHHYIQFFNIIMRKCLDHLNLQLVGRNFFDAQNKVQIKEFRIELWPGYLTSIRQCEHDILMCAEISHKVMRQETVYDMLEQFYMNYERDYKKFFSKEIMGQIVLTGYNNNTYRIDDVDYSVRPTSTFTLRDGERISYKNYYETKYGIIIRNDSQPLLVSRSKPKDRRAGQAELLYLVPELCRTTGLTDEMRSNYPTMNALATHTKLDPKARIERLMSFNRRLLRESKVVNELNDWGLKLGNKLVNLTGRVIPRDKIIMADGVTLSPRGANWDGEIRANKMLITTELRDWVVIITQRMKNDCQEFISGIIRSANGMRFKVEKPRIAELYGDRSSYYTEMIESVMSKSNPQLVMCLVPNNNLDRYSAIKKKCCVDRPVLSQVVLTRTIMSKGKPNLTAATKIAVQLNCKLGGAGWTVEIPSGNFMVAGFDVCHDKTTKGRDFGALVASLDRHLSRYFSAVSAHTSGEELSNDLGVNMTKACRQYQRLNGILPSVIIFYRDGVGEGQIPFVHEIEVQELKRKLAELYDGEIANVRMAFLIVTKKINTRFFYNNENAPAGTVVDDVVTNPARLRPNYLCRIASRNMSRILQLDFKYKINR